MQKEIIKRLEEEKEKIAKSLTIENPEIAFFEDFLQRINFADITTYDKVSIEELLIATVRSMDSKYSLGELKEITNYIMPILEKCTPEEMEALCEVIDLFTIDEEYDNTINILYSDYKNTALEQFAKDAKGDPLQEYIEKAVKVMIKPENERIVEFIEEYYISPDAWAKALSLAHGFYQIKEDKERLERNLSKYQDIETILPMVPHKTIKETLEDNYDIFKVQKTAKVIHQHLRTLQKNQKQYLKERKLELKKYGRIIDTLTDPKEEIDDYRTLIYNINNEQLRLEILKEVYQHNQAYYETLNTRYRDLLEKSKIGYQELCQKYNISTDNIDELMKLYTYKELDTALSILKSIGVENLTTAIKNTSIEIVEAIVELIGQEKISLDVVRKTPDIWNRKDNYPERISKNASLIHEITSSDELYKTRSQVNLIETKQLNKSLTTLKDYNLLNQLSTTKNYQFLSQDCLAEKIDLILELGKEQELTHNLGLLNYDNIRWKRLQILESLNIPVTEESLEGILHTDHFLVPSEKLEEYIETRTLPKETNINIEEIAQTPRTYIYRGISFSKNKVRRILNIQEEDGIRNYQEALIKGRTFTPGEMSIIKQKYTK